MFCLHEKNLVTPSQRLFCQLLESGRKKNRQQIKGNKNQHFTLEYCRVAMKTSVLAHGNCVNIQKKAENDAPATLGNIPQG